MSKKQKLKIIPLGGLDEIGKNLTVIEYGDDMMVIDCGMGFPDDEMLGIDLVIPDTTYLEKNSDRLRGIVLTHGHEDHIGALPYVLRNVSAPIYGTRLTLGLVGQKLKEHGILKTNKLSCIRAGSVIKLGQNFKVEFIRVNHSIADSVAVAVHTPAGTIVHTGDFKIDSTPLEGDMIDLTRFGELGKRGVLLLMSDSTNVERPGFTMSESSVGEKFDQIFKNNDRRIIVATFSSNVHRIQQIVNSAVKNKRKVAVSGRSMLNILEVSRDLGYMHIPDGTLIELDALKRYRPGQVVVITTGSQGEPMSALTRMAFSDHRQMEIMRGDLVILSSSPIPGNEKTISNVVNELYRKGAEVIHDSFYEVHVSGHACREELKIILGLTKPKYFMPVHGEYRHLVSHAGLATLMNVPKENIFIMKIGDVLELDAEGAAVTGSVPSGKLLVDGYGVGDVGNIVLRDRKHLGEDGLIVVVVTLSKETGEILSGPDVISRGFVYVRESGDLIDELKAVVLETVSSAKGRNHDWNGLKTSVRSRLGGYIYEKTKRRPMILPMVMEV